MPALNYSLLFALLPSVAHGANPNLPLDRPYTLLNSRPALLEAEYERQIKAGNPQSFIFPRPCASALDSCGAYNQEGEWTYSDSGQHRQFRILPLLGYEYRYLGSNAHAAELGLLSDGATGPLSFYLDARMFLERYPDLQHASYDREFVERQNEDESGSVAYSSYSRYRSNLSYDWSWGRLTAARDAAHWGPGQFANLVFQQDAIPFNQLTFTSHLGPLSIQTLYGQLAASGNWEYDTSSHSKSIYAHRYEWRASRDLLLGISEQLILYKVSAPFAFIPVVPLFIAKASEKERLNNGNIAADIAYRIRRMGRVYAEFLIDDIQSPSALFDDSWSNKWAWMAGTHWTLETGGIASGLILEYSRLEPWVYTHYLPHTAQTSHQDYPVGNPWGPNSQAIIGKAYLSRPGRWYISIRSDLVWKGSDPGSGVEDIHTGGSGSKAFLSGDPSPEWLLQPYAWIGWRDLAIYASASHGSALHRAVTGIQYVFGSGP
jgi:hypothetical protein